MLQNKQNNDKEKFSFGRFSFLRREKGEAGVVIFELSF